MFIEPTFSNLLHKALTTKPGSQADAPAATSFSEDELHVAVYDDQGREMPQSRLWNRDTSDIDTFLERERKTVAV